MHFNLIRCIFHGNTWQLLVFSQELNGLGTPSIPNDGCGPWVFSVLPLGLRHMSVWLTICHHPAHHWGFWGLLMATYSLVWSHQTTCALEGLNTPRSTMGQPRAAFDQSTIPERGRMQLAGSCSLQDNLLAMEKQCHPTPLCLRCVLDTQTLCCDSDACSVALPSRILSQKERDLQRQTASQQDILCPCAVWLQGMGAGSRSPRSALAPLHLAPCSPGKA